MTGYKVLLARLHYCDGEKFEWFEAEDIISWHTTNDHKLYPITIKHGLINPRGDYPRYAGIVNPDGSIVTIWGTFTNIEKMRCYFFDVETRDRKGAEWFAKQDA